MTIEPEEKKKENKVSESPNDDFINSLPTLKRVTIEPEEKKKENKVSESPISFTKAMAKFSKTSDDDENELFELSSINNNNNQDTFVKSVSFPDLQETASSDNGSMNNRKVPAKSNSKNNPNYRSTQGGQGRGRGRVQSSYAKKGAAKNQKVDPNVFK